MELGGAGKLTPVVSGVASTSEHTLPKFQKVHLSRILTGETATLPQYGNRPQEGAAEANITASCKAARMFAEETPSFVFGRKRGFGGRKVNRVVPVSTVRGIFRGKRKVARRPVSFGKRDCPTETPVSRNSKTQKETR